MSDISQRIQGDIETNQVMLYMKGTPMFPQCGFSARVIQILTHMGVPFQSANVLEDAELREGIKHFSQWHAPDHGQARPAWFLVTNRVGWPQARSSSAYSTG
jgi:glutaredoxin-related protein